MARKRKPNECYVYAVAVDGVIRYIGKGTWYRIGRHRKAAENINATRGEGRKVTALKFHNRLAKALRDGCSVAEFKIADGISSDEALAREILEIASAPAGQLWNGTAGGDGIDSETAKRLWADPKYRVKFMAARQSDGFRSKLSAIATAQMSNPIRLAKAISDLEKSRADPDAQARHIVALRRAVASEESRAKVRSAAKIRAAIPAELERRREIFREHWSKQDSRDSHGKKMKEHWSNPEFRAKATAHWRDPEKLAAIKAKLTPEFLKRRGEAISSALRARKKD